MVISCSRETYRKMFELCTSPRVEIDARGRFLHINQTISHQLDYDPDSFLSHSVLFAD
jgi:hypothetical protein